MGINLSKGRFASVLSMVFASGIDVDYGITRQTAVLAFQLGDGFSNSVLPTSSALMGYLVVSKIPYAKWLKFMMPLFLIWTLAGCFFMLGAIAIGY